MIFPDTAPIAKTGRNCSLRNVNAAFNLFKIWRRHIIGNRSELLHPSSTTARPLGVASAAATSLFVGRRANTVTITVTTMISLRSLTSHHTFVACFSCECAIHIILHFSEIVIFFANGQFFCCSHEKFLRHYIVHMAHAQITMRSCIHLSVSDKRSIN